MRKKVLAGIGLLFLVIGLTIFSPYNVLSEFNEKGAVKSFISSDRKFKGLEVVDIDYRGSDTYLIQTKDGDLKRYFIVMRYNSSVMNGHWKVFEETSREHYY
ncbi:hypothetical protein N780_01380 [Pontibacillus chungwhensis BH030062]|uniref:DUF3139 domain-containing protein n=1 Tax=Pontibacillus chungwhensis BH030062 TaxID=1385513 RepID=A0A0A2UWV8_9BACI|nr:hypothetical protein [Pontibacillus chungwhensis]KGP92379.1 hypothetical protein N780_01380 [Pontibacillus chungwhensis BH030062]